MGVLASADLLGWAPGELDALGARGLRDLYRSEAVLDAERRLLFARSWSLVATSDELGGPGDYVTATVAGIPVLVVRGADGALHAFHNLCRHRGLTLVEGAGRLGRHLTCPYHQWSFALDGSLVRVPQEEEQFDGIDKARWPLVPAAATEWHGMVFVNPAADAPGFAEAMGGLAERLESFSSGPLVEVAQRRLRRRVQLEAPRREPRRRLPPVVPAQPVPQWLRAPAVPLGELRRQLVEPGAPEGSLGRASLPAVDQRGGALRHRGAPVLPEPDDRHHRCLPGHLRRRAARSGPHPADAPGAGPGGDRRDTPVGDVRSFLAEDVEACRRLQEATGSPAFGVGPLAASHEEPVRRFHASLRRVLSDALG